MRNASRCSVRSSSAGSFSAAADALSYSQSAVSQAIATLEGEVGASLIERDRRGVRATPAGAALAAHAEGILARMEAAEAELAAIAGGRGGRSADRLLPHRGGDADAAGDRTFPRLASRRRGHPRGGRAGGDRPPAAGRRVRPGPAIRIRGRRREARRRHPPLRADGRPAPAGASRRPPACRSRTACDSRTSATSHGSRPPRPAPAPGTSSAPATRPASSPASPSKATTTRRSRAWSPRASASR